MISILGVRNDMQTRENVMTIVMQILQELSGMDFSAVNESTNVVKVLGLSTEDGLDLACLLAIKFECEIPHDINPLYNDRMKETNGYERTVGDIVDLICILTSKEASHV
jgi:hypothetical protein